MTAPFPPPDFHGRKLDLEEIPVGTILHRFYPAARDPIYFDTSDLGRFNAPDSSYGVLYTAKNAAGAFAETFLRKPGRTLIDETLLQRKAYARLITRKPLRLVRLAGHGLARIGATAEIAHTGLSYDLPQAWSQTLADALTREATSSDDSHV